MAEDVLMFEMTDYKDIDEFTCNKAMLEVLLLLKDNKEPSSIEESLNISNDELNSILLELEKQGVLSLKEKNEKAKGKSDSILWRGSVISQESVETEKDEVGDFIGFIIARLSEALGPLAELVVEDEIEDMGETREAFSLKRAAELVNLLSREIPREDKRITFQKKMMMKLKELG